MKKIISIIISLILILSCSSLFACDLESSNVDTGDNGKRYERETAKQVNKFKFRNIDGNTMPIGGYIGPYDYYSAEGYLLPSLITDQTFQKLNACGINYLVEFRNDFTTENEVAKRLLTLASKYNVNYLLECSSAVNLGAVGGVYQSEDEITKANIKSAISEMSEYKAFMGFYFKDEPSTSLFGLVGKAINELKNARSELASEKGDDGLNGITHYSCLFPSCGWDLLSQNGGNIPESLRVPNTSLTWEEYLEDFAQLNPDYLMFDNYPIYGIGDTVAGGWFDAIGKINDIANKYGKMWMGAVQAGGGDVAFVSGTRVVNEYELAWDINTMLAFGAKGLMYYPGVFPPEFAKLLSEDRVNEQSLLNKYGNTTPIYNYAKKINTFIQAMDDVLMNSAHEGVIIHGDSPCPYSGTKLTEYRALESVSGESALVGCFDYNGTVALLVVNNSITDHCGNITLNFKKGYAYEVTQRAVKAEISGKSFTLNLEAGESALVVVK